MTGEQQDQPPFPVDLYRGAARAYARFRLGYPSTLTDDLISRTRPSGGGRLLDLACGTGQLAFALGHAFAEVWAVDREPDMIDVVTARARDASTLIRAIVSDAEDLDAPSEWFELITVGNAFHRLQRELVAGSSFRWLQPGGHLALCWSDAPWEGPAEWQRALDGVLWEWRERLGEGSRVLEGWEQARRLVADAQVLADAGFVSFGRSRFTEEHRWTVPELAGFVHSTSFLPLAVLGKHAAAFEADLADQLLPHSHDGALTQPVSFAYDLFRRP